MYIETFDNVLTEQELILLNSKFTLLKYSNERDHPEDQPSGYSAELPQDITDFLNQKVSENISTGDYAITRCYVNLISNTDVFKFHSDYFGNGTARTALFYVNLTYNIDHYGETLFVDGNQTKIIFPKPGRMVWFDGKLPHSARSFNRLNNEPRFTIAIKYLKNV